MNWDWDYWWFIIPGYFVCWIVTFTLSLRWMVRDYYRRNDCRKVPLYAGRDMTFGAFLLGAIWPITAVLIGPLTLASRWAFKPLPEPDPEKIEGKKDWIEGYKTKDYDDYEEPW